uniref:hypothetical protein n=1 Tax=Arthrobacter sp. TaxID=1667 RepID=UPI00159EC73F|nr:hypothetical protein [Arthrobacter sp.]
MIRDNIEHNEAVKPNSHEIHLLRSTFPHYFDKEDNFLLQRLLSVLAADEVDLSKESFGLNFLGRSYANYVDGLATETVVIPDLGHNSDAANADVISQNIVYNITQDIAYRISQGIADR